MGKAKRSTGPTEHAIYSVAFLHQRAPGTRKVLERIPYAETSPGVWVRCDVREAGERADAKVPFGPRRVPESQMINFTGMGSGFSSNTPPLRIVVKVSAKDSERPFADIWDGPFRSSTWLVPRKVKVLLEMIDPEGFEYWPVETQVWQGGERMPDLEMWLCEPVRFLKCLDTPRSEFVAAWDEGKARFRAGDIGEAVFFREETTSAHFLFCNAAGRDAFMSAGLKGLHFDLVGYQHA